MNGRIDGRTNRRTDDTSAAGGPLAEKNKARKKHGGQNVAETL